jgi:hypothetical protein
VAALRRADSPSKEFYRSIMFYVFILMLDENRPEGVILQSKEKKM